MEDVNLSNTNAYDELDPLISRGRSSNRFQRARVRFESPTRVADRPAIQFPEGHRIGPPERSNHHAFHAESGDEAIGFDIPSKQRHPEIRRASSVASANQTFNKIYGRPLEPNDSVSQVNQNHVDYQHSTPRPPLPPPSSLTCYPTGSHQIPTPPPPPPPPPPSLPPNRRSPPSPPLSPQVPHPLRPALRRPRTFVEDTPENYYRNHIQTFDSTGNNATLSQRPDTITHEQENLQPSSIHHVPLTIQEDPAITVWNPASPFVYQRMSKRKLSPCEIEVLHSRATTILLERTFGNTTSFLHLSIPTAELVSSYRPELPGEAPPGVRIARSMVYTREVVDARSCIPGGATIRPKEDEFFYSRAQIGDDSGGNPMFVRILFKRSLQAAQQESPYRLNVGSSTNSDSIIRAPNRNRSISRTAAVMSGIWIVEFNRSALTNSSQFRFGTGIDVLRAFYSFSIHGEARALEDGRTFVIFEGLALTAANDEEESRMIPKQLRLRILKDAFDGNKTQQKIDYGVQLLEFEYRGAKESVITGYYEVRIGRSDRQSDYHGRDGGQSELGRSIQARLVFKDVASFCKVGVRFGDVRRRDFRGSTVVAVGLEEICI